MSRGFLNAIAKKYIDKLYFNNFNSDKKTEITET